MSATRRVSIDCIPLDLDAPDIGNDAAVACASRDLSARPLHATENDITRITVKPANVHR
ncbi:dsRBD fold-containing protein [Agromyces sp. MMS24-JH15]|uniref:dsRBD fold-containing protein n=1 Tax=Agromyces sp. MMS24-JH15 TaxID=3243765 RepID=UPI00374907F6